MIRRPIITRKLGFTIFTAVILHSISATTQDGITTTTQNSVFGKLYNKIKKLPESLSNRNSITTTAATTLVTTTEAPKRGALGNLYHKIKQLPAGLLKNAQTTTTIPITTTEQPSGGMLGNLYHRMKALPEKFTNKTKNMANEAYAEAQYCKDKINFNRKLAELTSGGSKVLSLQTLKQSYNMTKEYRRLKEEGKKYKLCSNRTALSWKTAMAGSLFKRLTTGS